MNNKKYTKKQSKENNKENKKTDKEKADKEESIDIDIDTDIDIGDEEVKNNKGKEETSLTQKDDFAERHPILAKIRDWFKGVKTSISRKLSYADYKKIGKDSEEVEETTKESKGRDAFIEELRRHVENDKADKELAYIEKHKAKTKTKEESEEEIEKWRETEQEKKEREEKEIKMSSTCVNEATMREILIQGEKERRRKIREQEEK